MRPIPLSLALAAACVFSSPSALAGNPERGQEKSAVCAACHGPTGISPVPDFPSIGGQHEKYLYRALLDYKIGNRQDPIMAGQVAELSTQDLRDLAAYFARQEGLYLKR